MRLPLDPCGRVVDLVRSCYRTTMRFAHGGPALPVRWYFCDPDAQLLGMETPFTSANWDPRKGEWDGLGEVVGATRTWDSGSTPTWATGQGLCGSPDRWESGWEEGEEIPELEYDAQGMPLCCGSDLPIGGPGISVPRFD